ncbi:hypothetical protein MY11210_002841 [Beauveria gryllotalpidicola]
MSGGSSSTDPPSYEFHSFHINIGVGDGSIHLLVDVSTASTINTKGKIIQAIFIDGGLGAHVSYNQIKKTIDCIKNEYEVDAADNGELKFDSIIVTHWDADHYAGMVQWLQKGLSKGFKDAGNDITKAKVPFLRYSNNTPATVMYAPYWVDEKVKEGPCRSLQASPEMGRNRKPVGVTGDGQCWMTLKPVEKNPKTNKEFARAQWPKILCLKTGAKNVLGMNFLNGQMPSTNDPVKLNSPQKILNENNPGENKPGMYCVAINNVVLGEQGQDTPPWKKPSQRWEPGHGNKDRAPFGLSPIIDEQPSLSTSAVDKNIRSISCVVMWKDGNSVRLSHYFAGDALWQAEQRILKWTQEDGPLTVAATKISHHGAVNATPLQFFDIMSPAKVIVSAGHDMSFGHPRWEFLFLVYSWMKCDVTARTGCLLCTNYPEYLVRDAVTKRFPLDNNTTTTVFATLVYEQDKEPKEGTDAEYDAYRNYKKKLQEYCNAANQLNSPIKAKKDLWSQFNDAPDMKAEVQNDNTEFQWQWIATKTAEMWETLSDKAVQVRTAVRPGGAVTGPSAATVPPKDTILHIKLMSRNCADDGETIVVGSHGKKIAQHIGESQVATVSVTATPSNTVTQEVVTGPPSEKMARLDASAGISTTPSATDAKTGTGSNIIIDYVVRDAPSAIRHPGRRARRQGASPAAAPANDDSTDSNGEYYIYCSGTATALGSSSATVLAAASVLDQLVSSLHYKQLVFTAKPTTSSTSFLADDEWNIWFTACFPSASFSATADSDGNIDAFRLSFDFPTAGDNTLVFSSAAASISHSFGQSAATLPAPGMLTDPCILVFGLDTANTTAWTQGASMASLLEYAGLDNAAALVPNATATLDMSAGRNAIWFTPWSSYKTVLRLVFTAESDALESFLGDVNSFTNISCSGVSVVLSATHTILECGGVSAMRRATVTMLASCSIDVSTSDTVSFEMVLEICQNAVGITLVTDASVKLSTILAWLKSVIGLDSDFEIDSWLQTKLGIQDVSIGLRRIFVNLDTESTLSVSSVGVDLEVKWAESSSSQPVVFLFNYTRWAGQSFGIFSGCLWCHPDNSLVFDYRKMLPEWEDWEDYHPACSTPAGYLDIKHLFPGVPKVDYFPLGMPTKIARVNVQISDDGIIFDGAIICPPAPNTDVPSLSLADLELNASYAWGGSLDLGFIVEIDLLPSSTSAFQDIARLRGDLIYGDSTWSISASIEDFRAAALYSLFETSSRDTVLPLIEALAIRTLYVEYLYGSGGEPSSFSCIGTLLLGPLELDLTFNHTVSDWEFFASLGSDQPESAQTSLGEIIQGIMLDAQLPEFVANISISAPEVKLAAAKSQDYGVVFSLLCTDGAFSFMFAQHSAKAINGQTKPKRVLKLAFKPFPTVPIPLVGQLAQPFEEIAYVWVQDSGSQDSTNTSGLTPDEISQINQALGSEVLLYKNKPGAASTDVVIQSGSHLVIVAETSQQNLQVIIDYPFSAPNSGSARPDQGSQSNDAAPAQPAAEGDGDASLGPDSTMVPLNCKQNGVTISNIGLQYIPSSKTIVIILDAAFTLGPISFALLGFGLKVPISSGTLRHLPTPVLALSGLGLGYDQQPIDIAGLFEVLTNDGSTIYEGGAIISLPEYEFLAAGYYGEDAAGYKSVFAFAELVGPLLSLEFAELSGVKGGFGYNSYLTLPTQDNVASFPFVGASFKVQDNALGTLEQLFKSAWVRSSQGDYWAAAGGRIDALQMLFVDAVFVCEFGHGLKLGVIADLVVHIPPPVSSEGRRFVYVNIGLLATIDLAQGTLLVAGQIGSDSFLLDPACGLSGEFALSYWFGRSTWQGQWVFTIGGYHPAFERPTYYPQADRLTIAWRVDSSISISGQGYFAITPKLCMGGGMLKAEYLNGDLEANLTAFADFLIVYDPFYFTADVGVTVYGRYSPSWLITGPASAQVDATLHLEGPPLCGSVTVEFFSFQKTFYFGTKEPAVRTRDTLAQFYTLLEAEGKAQPHLVTCVSGQLPKSRDNNPTSQQGDGWVVGRERLSFRVSSPFAFGSATFNSGTVAATCDQAIYSVPMMLSGSQKIDSRLNVDVSRGGVNINEVFTVTKVISNLPAALWGSYDQQTGDRASLLKGSSNAVIPLMAAVVLTAPVPQVPTTKILPFDIMTSMSKRIYPNGGTPKFPSTAVDLYSVYWAPDEPDSDEGQQYQDVKTHWQSPGISKGAKASYFAFSHVMGWRDEVELKTEPPSIALKNLENTYASAPLIAQPITSYMMT